MLKTLFEIEQWLVNTTNGIREVMHGIEPRLLEFESILEDYTQKTQTLSTQLQLFRNKELIENLKTELREAYLTHDKLDRINACVIKLNDNFREFWEEGAEFEEFYGNWPLRDDANTEALFDNLGEIRSFFKHETWDADPFNYNPTLESVLAEYAHYYVDENAYIKPAAKVEAALSAVNYQANIGLSRDVQDLYKEVAAHINRLPEKLDSLHLQTFYADESFECAITSLSAEFDSYFLEDSDLDLLKNEAVNNLRRIERDGSEFTYLKELDSLFADVQSLRSKINEDKWSSYFNKKYNDQHQEISRLIKSVTGCVSMLYRACNDTSSAVSNSLFIQERPAQFPHITSARSVESTSATSKAKLVWNCKPAVAGYIISELIRAGYIDPPIANGDLNYAELGRICSQLFEFKKHKPSAEGWRKLLNADVAGSNALPDYKRAKLKLPDIDQLT
ncbi:hypothetical protein M0L20_14850 [Spirosoma sp. RP8]|uniref:Uncharacterized protein n=1 Tax=Spirosoma liriopis TaxID=2937440 RepID=A0ABT0HLU7_9BACT|nr:hypothetical protein [Spirosoma liriopis]MCK8493146.1 hypothetical protein [Spirosoma liriopis]